MDPLPREHTVPRGRQSTYHEALAPENVVHRWASREASDLGESTRKDVLKGRSGSKRSRLDLHSESDGCDSIVPDNHLFIILELLAVLRGGMTPLP